MQATDTSAIQRLIGRARFRIRSQGALEGATTATILAAATALISIFAMRIDLVSRGTGIGLLVASGSIILIGALLGAAKKVDDEAVARRIDRASNLADRLSTAMVGTFVAAHQRAKAESGRRAFCGLDPSLREVFELLPLTDVFRIYANERQGLDALAEEG